MSNNAWQLDAEYFQLTNYAWSSPTLNYLKSKISDELNLNKDWKNEIWLECSKLILYEKCSIFKEYDEIEEDLSNGFVLGKLIIILPSFYTGGEHYISLSEEKHLFDFACNNILLSDDNYGALLLVPYHLKWELFMDDLPQLYTQFTEMCKQIPRSSTRIGVLIFKECIELLDCLLERKNQKFDFGKIMKYLMILCSIQRTLGISDDNSVMNVIKKFMKHKLFVEQ
ncbi:unnamed protein product, partial [Didymodactylos carnosus]